MVKILLILFSLLLFHLLIINDTIFSETINFEKNSSKMNKKIKSDIPNTTDQPQNEPFKGPANSQSKISINDTLLGVIIGGILGFSSSLGLYLFKIYWEKPKLSISNKLIMKTITYNKPDPTLQQLPDKDTDKFTAIRIKVENNGRSAAENCKA